MLDMSPMVGVSPLSAPLPFAALCADDAASPGRAGVLDATGGGRDDVGAAVDDVSSGVPAASPAPSSGVAATLLTVSRQLPQR